MAKKKTKTGGKEKPSKKETKPKATAKTAKEKPKGKVKKVRRYRRGKVKLNPIIDFVITTVLPKKMLLQYIANVHEDSANERRLAARLWRERGRIMTFWQISRNELHETKTILSNTESRLEETIERNEIELDAFKRKVKHVLYEQKDDILHAKIQKLLASQAFYNRLQHQRRGLRKDINWLQLQQREETFHGSSRMKDLKLQHAAEISQLRKELTLQLLEKDCMFNKKYSILINQLTKEFSSEATEVANRKKEELNRLVKDHAKGFAEMRHYFSNIVLNNWALIGTLKERMEVLRSQNECLTAELENATREHEKLMGPLKQCQKEVAYHKEVLHYRRRDKILLENTKAELADTRKQVLNFRCQHLALEYRYDRLVVEKKELDSRYLRSILELQRKEGLKTALLEKRMEFLIHEREVFECVVGELRREEGLVVRNDKFKRVLRDKNDVIQTLKYNIAKAQKAHEDMLANYEEIMDKYCVTQADLGFAPLRILPKIFAVKGTVHYAS